MNPYLLSVLGLALVAALAFGLLYTIAWLQRAKLYSAINAVSPGTAAKHENSRITHKAAAALVAAVAAIGTGQRFLLVKRGADDDTVTVAAAATDFTRGVCTDAPTVTGDFVNVEYHGGAGETRLVYLGAAVNQDEELVPHTSGGAQKLTGLGSGTYYPFGRAARAGSAGDIIEYVPCAPTPRVVP